MDLSSLLFSLSAFAPAVLMFMAMLVAKFGQTREPQLWRRFGWLSAAALLCALASLLWHLVFHTPIPGAGWMEKPWLAVGPLGAWLAVLVQFLGSIIGTFSSRYLQGEPGQPRYISALAGVLAAVHLLLLANHWLVLIAAWAMVGAVMQQLLCFYPDRPFALLAAHKKRVADRLADIFLLGAAALAWSEVGNGSFSDLWQHLAREGISVALQLSAVCLVLAVILRTALLPVHGWLIQVMEAPTPVSALLHAGVVNLGGFVLILFAPLLEAATLARWLLIGFGLGTALFAGLVMLTRISIKVRLAWSTVAQMGFMMLECGLGLYTLAALHLIGHSLYKAHAFLSASSVVQRSKLQMMRAAAAPSGFSLMVAPLLAFLASALVQVLTTGALWPWWWSGVLALAWAPLLWFPALRGAEGNTGRWRAFAGLGLVAGLTTAALVAHALPLGLLDRPDPIAGVFTVVGMAMMYLCQVALQVRPQALTSLRRWSYAGFYLDEWFTRLALKCWPTRWAAVAKPAHDFHKAGAVSAANSK
jgi:NAD(P)H-quinone oxidoreductase subunit 5